ncbi:MAG: hypothetical protein ACRD0P_24505, partial [Stackebrandtia sp.]
FPWPWPWPSPTGEPTETEESDDPDKPGDDDPDKPDPEKPDEPCDESELPKKQPKLGTEEAKRAAEALAACLAEPGSTTAENRDLPTASAFHPVIDARVMTMTGLAYGGVVNVPTTTGHERALEFTMDSLDLADMDQASGIDGSRADLHVMNMGGSAVLSGDVRLYVQRIEGLLFGVVPVVFTPDAPPPLIVPYLTVTESSTVTAYVHADKVELPMLEEPTR